MESLSIGDIDRCRVQMKGHISELGKIAVPLSTQSFLSSVLFTP